MMWTNIVPNIGLVTFYKSLVVFPKTSQTTSFPNFFKLERKLFSMSLVHSTFTEFVGVCCYVMSYNFIYITTH